MSLLEKAIKARSDDRGFCRTTIDELVADTGMSRSTVKRLIQALVDNGRLERRVKDGNRGGLLLRISTGSPTGSPTGSQPVQTGSSHSASTRGAGPEGALSPPAVQAQPVHNRSTAYRPARPHEVPESGAELVYTGDDEHGHWKRLNATLWIAPNGDAVSIRSMTPELRLRLRVDQNEDGSPNLEAVRVLRGAMEPYE